MEPQFEADMQEASGGRGDTSYFRTLFEQAVPTAAWLQGHGIEFIVPTYYLSVGPPRIQPVGGGRAIVERLGAAAKAAGVTFRFESAASGLIASAAGQISGIKFRLEGEGTMTRDADAVILATGGFQGSAAMMEQHFGSRAASLRLISPGTRFASGDGIGMAQALGAKAAGDLNGMHIEPVDPRSAHPAPVVLVYPYGIVVDRDGHRFFDEGGGLVHETWEAFARDIHFSRPDSIAYAILDSRLFEIEGYQRAIRSDVSPYRAETIEGLAAQISIPASNLRRTIDVYNSAATGDTARFDPARCDGLAAASTLVPPKSNWARVIEKPPFVAYPLVGAIAYTFGGLSTNAMTEVLDDRGPIPGLYAAGEITGHFHGTAPNAVSVLRALVFGRIAGQQAVAFCLRR
jgi:tricarballylate dehydrogenase